MRSWHVHMYVKPCSATVCCEQGGSCAISSRCQEEHSDEKAGPLPPKAEFEVGTLLVSECTLSKHSLLEPRALTSLATLHDISAHSMLSLPPARLLRARACPTTGHLSALPKLPGVLCLAMNLTKV